MRRKKVVVCSLLLSLVITGITGCGSEKNTDATPQVTDTVSESSPGTDSDTVSEADIEEATVEATEEAEPASNVTMPSESINMYEYYMGMGGTTDVKAIVDDGVQMGYWDYEVKYIGKELSFDELSAVILEETSEEPVPYFAFINQGDDTLLAIKYQGMGFYSEHDDSYVVLFLNYRDGELHITHSYSDWARNRVTLLESGLVTSAGSAGAGENIYTCGYIDNAGHYNEVYVNDWTIGSWMAGAMGAFDAVEEAYGGDIDAPSLAMNTYTIGEEKVYYPTAYKFDDFTEQDKAYLDIMVENGYQWVTQDEIDVMIDNRLNEIGCDSYVKDASPVVWTQIHKDEAMILPAYSSDWTSDWNYEAVHGKTIPAGDDMIQKVLNASELDMDDPDVADFLDYNGEEDISFGHIESIPASTGSFEYYISNHYDSMVVTPDNSYVFMEDGSLCDFIYNDKPNFTCADFDGDGEEELLIDAFIYHGTGFLQESLFIADKSELWDGEEWKVFHLTPVDYIEMISKHLEIADNGTELIERVDGNEFKRISKESDPNFMYMILDQWVMVENEGTDIVISSKPVLFSEMNPVGLILDKCNLHLHYVGDGIWEETGFELIEE